MKKINITFNNDIANGTITLPYNQSVHSVAFSVSDEEGNVLPTELSQNTAEKALTFFETTDLDALLLSVAKQVNEACYYQTDYTSTNADHQALCDNLQISEVIAYPSDVVLTLYSAEFLPDMQIACQIAYHNKQIENIEIYDK